MESEGTNSSFLLTLGDKFVSFKLHSNLKTYSFLTYSPLMACEQPHYEAEWSIKTCGVRAAV